MNAEKSQEILKAFGNGKINDKLSFSRQSSSDIQAIESMDDESLVQEWKSLVWLNEIYGQVSVNDLQRIALIDLEMSERPTINQNELENWYKEAELNLENDLNKINN